MSRDAPQVPDSPAEQQQRPEGTDAGINDPGQMDRRYCGFCCMLGRAMFTIESSSTSISCAVAIASSGTMGAGPPVLAKQGISF